MNTMKRFASYFRPRKRYKEVMYIMGLFVCCGNMKDLDVLFAQTATLLLTKECFAAKQIWLTMYDSICHRSIEEKFSFGILIDSSDGEEDNTVKETTEANPFVQHFEDIETRVLKTIVEDDDAEIKNAFYNPVAWKQFMSNWVPKIPMWTALALGDLG